jgi:hypothetical protein
LGEENASSGCTVKLRPSRNALRINSRYVGSLKIMSLERRPYIHTVS